MKLHTSFGLGIGFAAAMTAVGFAGGQGTATPESSVRHFVASLTKGDIHAAAATVKGGKVGSQTAMLETTFKSGRVKISVLSLRAKTNGNRSTVTVNSRTVGDRNVVHDRTEDVRMEKVGAKWLILPPKPGDIDSSKAPINSLAQLFSEGMSRVFADAKARAQQSMMTSNVKQLAVATLIFATDSDDRIATTAAGWHKAIFPYVKNEKLFRAANDPKSGDSFNLNPAVANVAMSRIKAPAKTVMVYQGRQGKLEFYNGGKAAVAFCDGSAKILTPAEAKKLNWKP